MPHGLNMIIYKELVEVYSNDEFEEYLSFFKTNFSSTRTVLLQGVLFLIMRKPKQHMGQSIQEWTK